MVMLVSSSLYAAPCDQNTPNACYAAGTCYWPGNTIMGCLSCPDSYVADHGANSINDCYQWADASDTQMAQNITQQKCYYTGQSTSCEKKSPTCIDDICNYRCADNYHAANNTCISDTRDCDPMPDHAQTCREKYVQKKWKLDTLMCDTGYRADFNKKQCLFENGSCSDYLAEYHPNSNLLSICTNADTNNGEILGNVTFVDGETFDTSQCLCRSKERVNHNAQSCYVQLKLVRESSLQWGPTEYVDCLCNEYFCPNASGICDIPMAGYYYDTETETCQPCPAGSTSHFGSNVAEYIKKTDKGIKNCFINTQTKFCDNAGCFTLPSIGNLYFNGE